MLDDAAELDPAWLVGKRTIGVTAGASAPAVLVQRLLTRLQALGATHTEEFAGRAENVVFPLPRNLAAPD